MDISKKKMEVNLVFDLVNENDEVVTKHNELWDGIKNEIKTRNCGKTNKHSSAEYDKDFIKIKFSSDDNLLLNTTLKLLNMTIDIRSVFEEDSKFYPQVYLEECLHEL